MKKVIDKADSRGHSLYDWLDSHHTFSFDEYYNARRMNFGALRVLNDDRVAPGKGFGVHPHKNMEIISIPLKGQLKHGDSQKNNRVITPGDIQTMSAGTGIYHSEMNGSDTEPVEFLQIWVMPEKMNTPPAYQDFDIRPLLRKNEMALIGIARRRRPCQTVAADLVLHRRDRSRKENKLSPAPVARRRLHLCDGRRGESGRHSALAPRRHGCVRDQQL